MNRREGDVVFFGQGVYWKSQSGREHYGQRVGLRATGYNGRTPPFSDGVRAHYCRRSKAGKFYFISTNLFTFVYPIAPFVFVTSSRTKYTPLAIPAAFQVAVWRPAS